MGLAGAMTLEYDERSWLWSTFLAAGYAYDWTPEQVQRLERIRDQVQRGERSEGATATDRLHFARWLWANRRINEGGPGDPEVPVPRWRLRAGQSRTVREDNVEWGE